MVLQITGQMPTQGESGPPQPCCEIRGMARIDLDPLWDDVEAGAGSPLGGPEGCGCMATYWVEHEFDIETGMLHASL